MRNEKITFACVSKPWLDKLKKLVPHVLPYVDRAVIVIGEDDQETKDYLTSLGPKVECYYYQWEDNFAQQWNNYLKHIDEGWILLMDDDETPSIEALEALDKLVEQSNDGNNFSFVEFRCHNISEGVLADKPSEYWRQVFFKYVPTLAYRGGTITGCHQYIVGYKNGRGLRTNLIYYHEKSLKEEYQHASRNYFIYGIWPHGSTEGQMRPEWYELRALVNKHHPEVITFPDLDEVMKSGKLHNEIKEFLVRQYNEFRDHPEYNEFRALVVYHFEFLHPEEAEQFGFVR